MRQKHLQSYSRATVPASGPQLSASREFVSAACYCHLTEDGNISGSGLEGEGWVVCPKCVVVHHPKNDEQIHIDLNVLLLLLFDFYVHLY